MGWNINICLTTNLNYIKYTASFLSSLINHVNPNYTYNVYILTDKNISEPDKEKILNYTHEKLSIKCIPFNHDFFKWYEDITIKWNGTIKWNYSYFYRWFIDKYTNVDKIIYFDTDMVINWDISELYNINLWNKIFWAVKDIFYMDSKLNKEYWIKYFFNSWLLLIDLKKWKENKMCEKLLKFKTEHAKETLLFDQDTLNVVWKDDWLCLSPKRNSMVAERFQYNNIQYTKNELKESKNPKVIHYTWFFHRPRKWIICLHPYCFKYFKFLRKTKYREKNDTLMFFQRCLTSNIVSRFIIKTLCFFWFQMKKILWNNTLEFLNRKAFK